MDTLLNAGRWLAAISLLVAPGSWLAFGCRFIPWPYFHKLCFAVILSPVVLMIQFLLLRWTSVPFAAASWLLVVVNLPALLLVLREKPGPRPGFLQSATLAIAVLLLVLTAIFPWLVHGNVYKFIAHGQTHSAIAYGFVQGQLDLEEPLLAGVRMAYQSLGHINWAVISYVMDWAPTRTFVLTHLAWLLATCGLVFAICRQAGCSPTGSHVAAVWLGLGTNIASWMVVHAGHYLMGRAATMRGDLRFTPWVRKFAIFELSAYGMALFAALLLVGLTGLRLRERRWLALGTFVFVGLGLIYPALFPVAGAFAGVAFWELLLQNQGAQIRWAWKPAMALAVCVLVAAAIVLPYANFLTRDRVTPAAVPSTVEAIVWRVKSAPFVFAPFLAGLLLLPWRRWKEAPLRVLLATAGAGFVAYLFLNMSGEGLEYKFVFGIALAAAPVVGLAFDHHRDRRWVQATLVLGAILILVPALSAMREQWTLLYDQPFPDLRDEHLHFSIASGPDRVWLEVLRTQTPPNTMLVAGSMGYYLPALAVRPMWVTLDHPVIPGYWIGARYDLLGFRGYSPELYNRRKGAVEALLGKDPERLAPALQDLRESKRPVAIILQPTEGVALRIWLRNSPEARMLFASPIGQEVWLLFEPRA